MHRADLSPARPGLGQSAENPLTAQVGAHFTPTSHIRPNARSASAASAHNNDGGKTTAAPDLAAEKHKNAAATLILPCSPAAVTIQELSANIEF